MNKQTETNILGDEKSEVTKAKTLTVEPKAKIRQPKLGEHVVFISNGDREFSKHVGLVTRVYAPKEDHPSAIDTAVFFDSFLSFRTRIPYQKEETSGTYQWLT